MTLYRRYSKRILLCLFAFEVALLLLFIITSLLPDYNSAFISAETAKKLHRLFHLGLEKNVPSAFSALQLLGAGLAALYCLRTDMVKLGFTQSRSIVWISVCLVFLYLAWDEYFSYHEGFGQVFEKSAIVPSDLVSRVEGYMNIWTIAAAFLVLFIGGAGIITFQRIFAESRYLLVLLLVAGFVFVFGALGLENIQTYLAAHNINMLHLPFFFQMAEEFLEMFGVSLSIFVFVRYIEEAKIKA